MNYPTRREFLKIAGIGLASAGVPSCIKASHESVEKVGAERVNVLLVMTDDQGWGDIGSHGNDLIDTPVIDGFADEGARFERFFVSPVCSPTRASLLTGRYHLRGGTHGVTRARENMRAEEVTFAEFFSEAGYATGCFGKWHNGLNWPYHPNGQGFDEFVGFCAGHWNNYFDTTLEHNGEAIKTKGYIADVLTDYAIGFIKKNRKRPFFCYVPYNTPHSPYQVPDEYFDKYKGRGLDDELACIYGMCENIDDNFGRLLRCLDESGLRDNTIVMFLTDNGPQTDRFNGDMRGRKGSEHEGGVRVPCFIRRPGRIDAGRKIEQIASHIDVLPTLVELCGFSMPNDLSVDGVSLVPLLEGVAESWPDRMIFTFKFPRGGEKVVPGSVRTQRWRAVWGGKKWQLYDMVNDPRQKKNVAGEYPGVARRLGDAYETACKEATKDGFDVATQVGYREWPMVALPGHEARLEKVNGGGISYMGRYGWANDWVTKWTDVRAYPWWNVEVVRGGRYEVVLKYACKKEDVGAKIRVEFGNDKLEGVVDKAHEAAALASPDRVKRGEVYERVWGMHEVGVMELKKGKGRFIVRALEKAGGEVAEIKSVHLRRID